MPGSVALMTTILVLQGQRRADEFILPTFLRQETCRFFLGLQRMRSNSKSSLKTWRPSLTWWVIWQTKLGRVTIAAVELLPPAAMSNHVMVLHHLHLSILYTFQFVCLLALRWLWAGHISLPYKKIRNTYLYMKHVMET